MLQVRLKDQGSEPQPGWLSLALGAGGLGAWDLTLATGALIATQACKAIFGRAAHQRFAFEDLLLAIHPDDRSQGRAVFDAAKEANPGSEVRIVWPDGCEHRIELRGHAILDSDGAPVRMSGVVSDVSERYRAKERLERMQAELAHVVRQNEMGQMASALAHELNQPLAAALNYMRAAENFLTKADQDQTRSAIAKAEAQFERATAIIRRIRGFVAKGKTTKAKEDVGETIAEVLELARVDPRFRSVMLHVDITKGLPPALIDKVQIQQVLLNLLRNAVEALQGRARREIAVSAHLEHDAIVLRVADSGPGLAPDIAQRLFEPFQTTKEDGLGVGLSLCRAIVEAHGGALWNVPGDGATFCFTLPVA